MALLIHLFYALLSVLSLALIIWRRGGDFLFSPFALPGSNWVWPVAAGLGTVALVHFFSLSAVKRWPAVRESAKDVKRWLGDLSRFEILAVALSSGIGEELFFRGWLLNETGLLISSLLFGAAHIPPNENWYFWPFFAFLIGLLLGGFCLWTQTLLFSVLIHAGINYYNIRWVAVREEI